MNTEIFIEGKQADLSADVAALFTYAVDDVADFSYRNTSFSKTITLPGSALNNHLFGHAFEFSGFNKYDSTLPNVGTNFNAAKGAQCIILAYGVQIFKGIMRLLEIKLVGETLEYEVAVFGELGGLISAIGNRKLTGNTDTEGRINAIDDLDFSSYNQFWTFVNIIQTWADLGTYGGGFGLYYPLIDYGLVTTDHANYKYNALRPALYVHEYIVKIFEKAGYTYECAFMETAFFKRLIIPHNEDNVYKLTRNLLDNQAPTEIGFLQALTPGSGGTLAQDVSFTSVVNPPNNFTTNFTSTGTSHTYNAGQPTILARLSSKVDVIYGGGNGQVIVTMTLRVNGSAVDTKQFTLIDPYIGSGYPTAIVSASVSLDAQDYLLNANDVITVAGTVTYPGLPPGHAFRVNIQSSTRLTIVANNKVAAPASYGDFLSINQLIPKGILQKDLLLSIVKMFNLYIIEDTNKKRHLKILPFPDFYDNTNPLDWNSKLDWSKEIALKPMSEVNARYFNFQYEKDTDHDNDTYFKRYGAGYADRTHDVGLDFVQEKKDLKLIFAPSPLVGFAGKDKYVTRIMKRDATGVESRTESKIRILQAKRIGVTSWSVLDDSGAAINNTVYYGYAGHVDDPITPQGADLNFGAPAEIYWTPTNPYTAPNLFNAFYSAYMNEITDKDSKLLTAYLRLTEIEINNIDFARAVLLMGQLWRLNKVTDYNAVNEDTTKCELLKVIRITY